MPYFPFNLKSPSPPRYLALARAALAHKHVDPARILGAKAGGRASSASTGRLPWQPHPHCQPVGLDVCGTLTQWQGIMKKNICAAVQCLLTIEEAIQLNVLSFGHNAQQATLCDCHVWWEVEWRHLSPVLEKMRR